MTARSTCERSEAEARAHPGASRHDQRCRERALPRSRPAFRTEQVSDAHLAGLRRDGVSYIFAGKQELDLALALETLNRELGIEQLLLEGGGKSNGSFLRAGLIDEISLAVCPAVDGARGGPYAFDSREDESDARAPLRSMTLESCEILEGGAVWLRYRLQNG